MEEQQDWCPCDIPCSAVSGRFAPDRDECSQHANYPSSIMSKIDWTEDMSSSVKSHVMHILVASGSDPTKWPEEVISVKGSYIQTLDDLLSSARAELPKVRLSLSDGCSLDEYGQLRAPGEVEDVNDPDTEFDLLMFPAQIRVKRVKKSELNKFVQHLIQWLNQLNKPNVKNDTIAEPKQGTIAVEEEPTPASASSSSSSSSSSSCSIFPLPSESIDGTSFLICSHKLRDKRCGVSGPILVDEIDRTIAVSYPSSPLPSPIHTFKVSHIGGHKYAGNVIVYPPGIWYGRVLPCHVPHLLLAHSPNFELVDMSSGEKRILQANDETVQTELAKLKPLIRGMVDGAKASGSKGGKAASIAM